MACILKKRMRGSDFYLPEHKARYIVGSAFFRGPNPPDAVRQMLDKLEGLPYTVSDGGRVTSTIEDEVLDLSGLSKEQRKKCFDSLEGTGKFRHTFKNVTSWKKIDQITGIDFCYDVRYKAGATQWYLFALTEGVHSTRLNYISGVGSRVVPPIKHEVTPAELSAAFSRMDPQFDDKIPSVELGNFLLELRELKRVVTLPKNVVRNSGSITGNAGDGFVGTNFGVLPVVSDILKVQTLLKNISGFFDRWNRFANDGTILDYHTTIWNFSTEPEATNEKTFGSLSDQAGMRVVKDYAETTSIAKAHLYVKAIPTANGAKNLFLFQQLGLTNPAAIVWEAIPFSWLVDYFLNISDLIDSFVDKRSPFKFIVVDAGYSVKTAFSAYTVTEHTPSPVINSYIPVHQNYSSSDWVSSKTDYKRVRIPTPIAESLFLQKDDWHLEGSAPNPHQTLLSVAVTRRFL